MPVSTLDNQAYFKSRGNFSEVLEVFFVFCGSSDSDIYAISSAGFYAVWNEVIELTNFVSYGLNIVF